MIETKNLSYTYPSGKEKALKDINFTIEKGEIFGFLGPSGSGKSTTQKLLYKLLSGYNGSAKIDGKEIKEWNHSLYEKIGVSFELPNHYLKLTAIENLEFFASFYQKKKNDLLKLLDQVGLKNEAHKKVGEFSKGMKMRLNFIRSNIHDPEILFLDEPTSGLDPVNAKIIKDLIREYKSKGKTIFITTHQMHDADELCDRVAFIVDGEIKIMDTPSNLKVKNSNRKLEVQLKNHTDKKIFNLDSLANDVEFLKLLKNELIETMHSKEASLDDVFIKVTGKSLIQ